MILQPQCSHSGASSWIAHSKLSKADQLRTGKERSATETLTALDAAAAQIEGDAKSATGVDQKRLNALADTLRRRAASLR